MRTKYPCLVLCSPFLLCALGKHAKALALLSGMAPLVRQLTPGLLLMRHADRLLAALEGCLAVARLRLASLRLLGLALPALWPRIPADRLLAALLRWESHFHLLRFLSFYYLKVDF